MLERFTERARRVMVLATEEARNRKHAAVVPEHLLMGILRDGGGLAINVLERLRVSVEAIRVEIERVLAGAASSSGGQLRRGAATQLRWHRATSARSPRRQPLCRQPSSRSGRSQPRRSASD